MTAGPLSSKNSSADPECTVISHSPLISEHTEPFCCLCSLSSNLSLLSTRLRTSVTTFVKPWDMQKTCQLVLSQVSPPEEYVFILARLCFSPYFTLNAIVPHRCLNTV